LIAVDFTVLVWSEGDKESYNLLNLLKSTLMFHKECDEGHISKDFGTGVVANSPTEWFLHCQRCYSTRKLPLDESKDENVEENRIKLTNFLIREYEKELELTTKDKELIKLIKKT